MYIRLYNFINGISDDVEKKVVEPKKQEKENVRQLSEKELMDLEYTRAKINKEQVTKYREYVSVAAAIIGLIASGRALYVDWNKGK